MPTYDPNIPGTPTQEPYTGAAAPYGGKYPEGKTTSKIEQFTAQAPSAMWLWFAGGAIAGSLALFFKGYKEAAVFVGLWPPTFLLLGTYNKIVKEMG